MTRSLPMLGAHAPQQRAGQPMISGLRMMARTAPPVLNRAPLNGRPMMGANDRLGDCTAVGIANHLKAIASLNHFDIRISDGDVISFYGKSTGYDRNKPGSDQGGVEVDVLAHAAQNSFALPVQTLYPIWGSLDPHDMNALRLVSASLGVGYIGLALSISDQAGIGDIWDTDTPPDFGDPTPASWGYHCALSGWSYYGVGDTDIVLITTWGTQQRATWRWLRSRITEAHALLWPQLASPIGNFISVAEVGKIKADNAAFLSAS